METRVFKYKIKSFTCTSADGTDAGNLIVAELKKYEDHKKALIEGVHVPLRRAFVEERSRVFPELAWMEDQIASLNARVDSFYEALRAARQAARKKLEFTPEQKAQMAPLLAERKALIEKAGPLRVSANKSDEMRAFSNAQNELKKAGYREARKVCGLYWGTYQKSEEAVKQASIKSKGELSFRGYKGEGGISVHFQSTDAKTVEELFDGKSTLVKMARPEQRSPSSRRRKPSSIALKIGKPYHAVVACEIIMHRDMPDSGRVSWIQLKREMVGAKWEYFILFTVSFSEAKMPATGKSVALSLSFQNADGRIAEIMHPDTSMQIMTLPSELVRAFNHEAPRSRSDKEFDVLTDFLVAWAKENACVPEWLRTEAMVFTRSRSHKKLTRLLRHWEVNRFSGDEGVFEQLRGTKPDTVKGRWNPPPASLSHIKHLDDWYASEQAKALRRRQEIYRCVAKRLAVDNDVIVVQDPMLKQKAESDNVIDVAQGTKRHNYALSEFVGELKKACRKTGAKFVMATKMKAEDHKDRFHVLTCLSERERLDAGFVLGQERSLDRGDEEKAPAATKRGRKATKSEELTA